MRTLPALIMAALSVSIAMAQSAGTFTTTGSMTMARFGHTATLLPDGRVLIAGGLTEQMFSPTAAAELYDPVPGTFTATGSLIGPRYQHTATLLPDGRVLIAGGGDAAGHLSLTAELYDPATGMFTQTGGMAAGHWSAILLDNGKVLMGPSGLPLGLAELYDPSTGTFAATGSYADQNAQLGPMTLLADGRVLSAADSSPEIYDPATGAFSLTGAMVHPQALLGRSATLLANGKVLFAGGGLDNEYNIGGDPAYPGLIYPYSEIFDPSSGSFATTANLIEPRTGHTATLLPDGTTLIIGGCCGSAHELQSTELYDPSGQTFRSAGNLTAGREFHRATLLLDGRVLITGGSQTGPPTAPVTVLASAELYTPALPIPAPALFSLSGDGQGQGAIWHATTGALASAANPAVASEILAVYTNNLIEGGVIPPRVAVGGQLAEVLYFGDAPGYPGYYQVNFRVPVGVASGPDVSVRLTYLGRSSNAVTITMQ